MKILQLSIIFGRAAKQFKFNRSFLVRYFPLVAILSCWQIAATAGVSEREQAKRIHERLVGVPPSQAMLAAMEDEIINGSAVQAALNAIDGDTVGPFTATANPGFYNITLKNWASPWTNEEDDVFAALNDYTALVIGLVRDEVNFQHLLYEDVYYVGNPSTPMPGGGTIAAYSTVNNNHYEDLEASGADLSDPSVLQSTTQVGNTLTDARGVAGIFSTRAAAKAFYSDGTNRAMLRFTLRNHLCNDMEQLKDVERSADRIRQDVSRSPGGDSRIFLTSCVGCHSGMDPLAQAFAFYEWDYTTDKDAGSLVYTHGSVQGKYTINSTNFKNGFVTTDDSWVNYWRQGANVEKLGWLNALNANDVYTRGTGASSMGEELANSTAFATCQVVKAFKAVCLREPAASDQTLLDGGDGVGGAQGVIERFMSGYNMKNAFAELAASCASHL